MAYGGVKPLRQVALLIFVPDGNGMRYKKEVNGYTTEYYLNGSQILMENRINNGGRVYYLYDVSGIAGMKYNNEYYYFDKNTLGDVIGIRNKNGTTVATYEYDAWGNITYQSGAMAEVNPFRYRGYYYDMETGFYYLQTRKHSVTSRVRIFGLTSFRLILLVKIKSTILEYFLHYQFYTYKKVPTE